MKCQSAANAGVVGVCPEEYSNICNTQANDLAQASGFPNDLCGCQDPSLPNPPTPTTFCTDASQICKADNSGNFGCQNCATGDCPDFAPLCYSGSGECRCGSNKPFANPTATDNSNGLNLFIANTCSGNAATDMFTCASTGSPCDAGSINPFCLDSSLMPKIGDLSSTCKVLKIHYKLIQIIEIYKYEFHNRKL